MEVSIFLARVIGLVSVVTTLSILLRYKNSMSLEYAAAKLPGMIPLSGFVFIILGVLIVVSHPVWVADWRVLITIIGWLVLIKGVGRMLFPDAVTRMIEKKQQDRRFLAGEIAVLLIGLYFLYYGFLV